MGGRPERKNETGHLGVIWSANLEALFFTRRIMDNELAAPEGPLNNDSTYIYSFVT